MSKDYSYIRIITSVIGSYRTQGIGHNFHNMEETSTFIEKLVDADLSGVKQIRIIPREVVFTKPIDAAKGIDGKCGRCW